LILPDRIKQISGKQNIQSSYFFHGEFKTMIQFKQFLLCGQMLTRFWDTLYYCSEPKKMGREMGRAQMKERQTAKKNVKTIHAVSISLFTVRSRPVNRGVMGVTAPLLTKSDNHLIHREGDKCASSGKD
jgi:hypothetical protein